MHSWLPNLWLQHWSCFWVPHLRFQILTGLRYWPLYSGKLQVNMCPFFHLQLLLLFLPRPLKLKKKKKNLNIVWDFYSIFSNYTYLYEFYFLNLSLLPLNLTPHCLCLILDLSDFFAGLWQCLWNGLSASGLATLLPKLYTQFHPVHSPYFLEWYS